jgi:predicted DNA-binding transcriptional regulator AlpA
MENPTRKYLRAAQVRARYGGISDMTLWRWLNSPTLGFPKPIRIRRDRLWNEVVLDDYDRACAMRAGGGEAASGRSS